MKLNLKKKKRIENIENQSDVNNTTWRSAMMEETIPVGNYIFSVMNKSTR